MCVLKYRGNHPIELLLLSEDLQTQLRGYRGVLVASSLLQLTVWSSICQGYNLVSKHLFDLILCKAGFPALFASSSLIPPISGSGSRSWT